LGKAIYIKTLIIIEIELDEENLDMSTTGRHETGEGGTIIMLIPLLQ